MRGHGYRHHYQVFFAVRSAVTVFFQVWDSLGFGFSCLVKHAYTLLVVFIAVQVQVISDFILYYVLCMLKSFYPNFVQLRSFCCFFFFFWIFVMTIGQLLIATES